MYEDLIEIIKNSTFEFFMEEDFKTITANRQESSKYRIEGTIRDINCNDHYNITVKKIADDELLTMNGWTLKNIFFQKTWNTLCTPAIDIVTPDDEECTILYYGGGAMSSFFQAPLCLKKYIFDKPNGEVTFEDQVNRILEGLRIFLEVQTYPDIKRYSLLNDYKKEKTIDDWNKRFIEVYNEQTLYTEERIQSFLNLYCKKLKELYQQQSNL